MSANAGTMGWGSSWSGSGQNLAYRKSEFDRIGGFSPVLHQISGDDMYLIQSISKHKRAIFNTSRTGFVTTAPVSTLKMYLNQRIRWASNSQKLMDNNLFFLLFLLSTLICNVFILTSPFSFGGMHFLLVLLGIKALFDGLIIYTGSTIFHTSISLVSFIVWFLFQPIYIPLVGVLGLAGAFSWKK
jgi:cellulose synthase/poly-beta-1,6-N-acetylglucosamine synthase-like glycosyltransferase